jgi:hypothetical protein
MAFEQFVVIGLAIFDKFLFKLVDILFAGLLFLYLLLRTFTFLHCISYFIVD